MKTKLLAFLMLALALGFTACDDEPEKKDEKKYDAEITAADDFDAADLYGNIASGVTVTLKPGVDYLLTGALVAKEGATLVIEPGTVLKAKVGGADVYVAIEQGATINAEGTATAPITITSAAATPRSGDWGGLIIAGQAPINKGATATAEVVGLTYGGSDAADNSGVISHVILEYTGARLSGEQEFNGFTFYGVGSRTTVNNLVCKYGDDDGVEFFGGAVNVTNILCVNIKDDMFDWTDGYTGTITNACGVRENGYNDVTEDPRGVEGDSNSSDNAATPVSNPTINGLTIFHDAEIEMKDMIKVRRGSGATITNAFIQIGGRSSASDFVDLEDSKGNAIAATSITVEGVGVDVTDNKNSVGATINATVGAIVNGTSDVDAFDAFSWAGYSYEFGQAPNMVYDDQISSANDFDSQDLNGDILDGVTVTLDGNYVLTGALVVKAGAILKIKAGTEIKCAVGGADVYVAVEQGATIEAEGTAEAPIVIESKAAVPRAGDWGGLIVCGYAKINKGATATAEVASLTYGGDNDLDNSGVIKHVILKHTGARLSGEQEYNGFTFYAVGSATTVENIACFEGDDDGIEFFGGTVNVKNALCVNIKDDMFDWTDGYTGKITNAFGVREDGYTNGTEDPRGIEGDSNSSDNTASPVSNPTINGLTIIHDAKFEMTDMIKVRRGSSVTISDAFVQLGKDASASDFIDLEDSKGNAISSVSITAAGVNVDLTDVKNAPAATINASEGTAIVKLSDAAAFAAFAWTGYDYTLVD